MDDLEKHREEAFLCNLLPKPLLTSAQQAMVEVGACLAEVHVVLADGWEGNPHVCSTGWQLLMRKGCKAMKGWLICSRLQLDLRLRQSEGQHAGQGSPGH